MSDDDMKAELDRLRNENAALKKGASSSLRLKVSEKGALSVYGMGRFPVTLYKEQWLKLLGMADEIRAFIAANDAQLKAKDGAMRLARRNQRASCPSLSPDTGAPSGLNVLLRLRQRTTRCSMAMVGHCRRLSPGLGFVDQPHVKRA